MPDPRPNEPAPSPRGLRPPSAQLDLPALEKEILALWEERGIEARALQTSQGAGSRESFVFYDGPPFATGLPHYGHLLAGTIKDVVPRFWTMRGRYVERRFGWDCHGLPIENLIENELGVHGRAEIEELGVPTFNAACRAGVLRYTAEWEVVVKRMGRWVDFVNDYKTMDASFMESVWWVFRQLWDKGLIYEGYRVQPVSPALGTPLSNFEVAQGPQEKDPVTKKEGHRRRQDPSLTVRFALEDEPGASLWAWTTTPWTLPSNLALAVHPEVEYVKVRLVDTGEVAYLEPGRLAEYQARGRVGATEELARLRGADLVGRPYAPLLPYFAEYRERDDGRRWAFKVVAATYVTTDSGTGIVHQAPAFGEDDYAVGLAEGLPLVNPLSLNGIFDESVADFAGLFAKDADKGIVERLRREGKVVDQDVIVHPYPHCYRTDQPLLYMAISTWFMNVERIRERLVELNREIRWVPEHVGVGRFGNWLENARDWNLSRNRYWGTPLPIWRCDRDPSEMVCVGSVAELEELAGLERGSLSDLHRETIDPITWPSKAGGTMRRIPEVFDCWFESGSMPYAQNHYPFDAAKKSYVEDNLPADFIAEGLDQTRGWFYTLHVLAGALFDRPAFRNVIVNGLILAADGKKMSKRLKNYPDPSHVIESYGADALRAYLISSQVVRAEPMRFGKSAEDTTGECVRDMVRVAILPLWNAYNFLATYAAADGWQPSAADLELRPSGDLDRWILSRVQGMVAEVIEEYESYALWNIVPAYLRLCDDLNNWYIRRGRRRYWRARGGDGAAADAAAERDKAEAYGTLFRALVTVATAMAPVIPFFSEVIYQRLMVDTGLASAESVHLAAFPEVDASLRDHALEEAVAHVRRTVAVAQALREKEGVAVRRPLPTLTVAVHTPDVAAALRHFEADVLGELNVKALALTHDDADLVTLKAKANFKSLGKRLGGKMKAVAAAIAALDQKALRSLGAGGRLEVEGEALTAEDVILVREPLAGQAVASDGDVTVMLDLAVTPALAREGLAREVINRVQNLRKQAGLEVSQRIILFASGAGEVAATLGDGAMRELIAGETLAIEVVVGEVPAAIGDRASDAIDGDAVELGLTLAFEDEGGDESDDDGEDDDDEGVSA
ncbi:MAG: isoleucine--tRNA ligase [Myxococcales bacterium]|nr:isoleucine--tRNA ligase [Myxococcales bacterium]